jgi:dinuclear metal center YbgI/SA1388 family protein
MKIRNILKELDKWSPFSLQESYDNSGLILGHPEMEINKILITLDITEAIIEEAIVSKYNLIISHHPIIFRGIKSLTDRTPEERILKKAIKNDIAIVALHTNLDNVHHGVNAKIGEILGLTELNILSPMEGELKKLVVYVPKDHLSPLRSAIFDAGAGHIGKYDMCSFGGSGHGTFRGGEGSNPFVGVQGNLHQETEIRLETIFPAHISSSLTKAIVDNHPYEEPVYDIYNLERENPLLGAGMTGILAKPVNEKEFLAQLKEKMGAKCIRHSCYRNKPIKKVAFCGGSGSFFN